MMKLFSLAAFAAGLATVGWVGTGYIHAQPLALLIIVLIAGFYLLGSWELLRFSRATQALAVALHGLSQTPARLDDWLASLPAGLRHAVRQRVEGARSSLPGPVLASYLSGLLVLLGMLGTFGGMVVALNGTGAALAGADGLEAMRDALSVPVRGLGLAFGTSVAGVAASAMLGLMTALCRRDRIQAARRLDAATAGPLRPYSSQHQREASLRLQEQQADSLPQVVSSLQDCMSALERQQQALGERLAAEQQRFYRETEAAYTALATTVQRTLADTAAQSAAQAGAAIRPVTEATLAALARESRHLQEAMAQQVGRQLDAMATRFGEATSAVSTQWTSALSEHRSTGQATARALGDALERFTQGFEQRTADLAADLAQRLSQQSDVQAARWDAALERQSTEGERLAERQQQALKAATDGLAQHAGSLQATVDQAHQGLQDRLAAQEERRLAQWTQALQSVAATLTDEWRQAGAQAAKQQQQTGDALARAAGDIARHMQAQAQGTLDEVQRLVHAAADAPRAAAQAMGELRQQITDSIARDNAMLDERARLLESLSTLLAAAGRAADEQRGAIDALVAQAAGSMDRAGGQFAQTLDAQTARLEGLAAQVGAGASEIASLGEAFGGAVQLFGQASEQMLAQLQRIEAAMAKSLSRSDEQLDYYVAQAREVIELSVGAQKQIIDGLQQVAALRAEEAVQ
ncbi:MAG: DUF802 domain-containing protein [Proteobacteria bacterium]|nr:DUF802 domain-containing protein [Pseudomonadota bacterium]